MQLVLESCICERRTVMTWPCWQWNQSNMACSNTAALRADPSICLHAVPKTAVYSEALLLSFTVLQ